MKWQLGRRSENVEDQRGLGVPGFRLGGCGLILIVVISLLTGQNPLRLIGYLMQEQPSSSVSTQQPQEGQGASRSDPQVDFVSAVLGDTEETWSEVFSQMNRSYQPPKLVLFSDAVQSACGMSSTAVGPFYCPLDDKVYLDLSFFRELDERFGASGDFARAYVIAHEVGHHVQNLIGISDRVHSLEERGSQEQANALSVGLELQADCLAGVWANHADKERHMLESGDVEEGLNAAAAVGDDRLQKSAGRAVTPETWTHGSSKMRVQWFNTGLESGTVQSCNTFNGKLAPGSSRGEEQSGY